MALQGQFTKLQKENPLIGDKCTMSRDCYAVAVEGEALTVNGRPCPVEHIVVENEGGCIPGDPHFDPEGAVCVNDGKSNEAYCSYDVGPTACARCTTSLAVAPSDSKHFVVMSVTMPYSKSDFGGPLQAQFRAAVASAASTYPANVEIVSITEKRRRAEGSIDVETKVQYDKDEECIWSGNLSDTIYHSI